MLLRWLCLVWQCLGELTQEGCKTAADALGPVDAGFGNNTTDYTAPFGSEEEALTTHLQVGKARCTCCGLAVQIAALAPALAPARTAAGTAAHITAHASHRSTRCCAHCTCFTPQHTLLRTLRMLLPPT
jgi:hypothetical protein